MFASIEAVEYYLPDDSLTTERLVSEFPEWRAEKIDAKTGIHARRIAAPDECASDLACRAAEKLFASGAASPRDIDFLLFCTQSPDFILPTTACLIQRRLGVPTRTGALDFNLGCSGFVYGLGLAQGLVETGQADRVLLLTAETYSKLLHPKDRATRTIFGDAGSATLIAGVDSPGPRIGPFVYGTDGRGADHLIVRADGAREPGGVTSSVIVIDEYGNLKSDTHLYMNGHAMFVFALAVVPVALETLLAKAGITVQQVDLFVLHQANKYMLDQICREAQVPAERCILSLRDCGNTVSSSIPIALKYASICGRLRPGATVALAGFGVGLSWAATLVRSPIVGCALAEH